MCITITDILLVMMIVVQIAGVDYKRNKDAA